MIMYDYVRSLVTWGWGLGSGCASPKRIEYDRWYWARKKNQGKRKGKKRQASKGKKKERNRCRKKKREGRQKHETGVSWNSSRYVTSRIAVWGSQLKKQKENKRKERKGNKKETIRRLNRMTTSCINTAQPLNQYSHRQSEGCNIGLNNEYQIPRIFDLTDIVQYTSSLPLTVYNKQTHYQ